MTDLVSEYVVDAIEKMIDCKYSLALVAICNAIDATARKEYKSLTLKVGERYKKFLSDNLLIITKASYGIAIRGDFRFGNVFQNVKGMGSFKAETDVSIVDIVYHVVRCHLTHEAKLPLELKFHNKPQFINDGQALIMPISLVFGLIAAVVGAPSNSGNITQPDLAMNFPSGQIPLDSLWGQKDKIEALLMQEQAKPPSPQNSIKQVPIRKDVSIPGRNDLCLCGSGKKYKRCCGA